jgi:uncharacterized iron-regulated membrane protein
MLHEGSALGITWRFLTFLGGLLPALLMVTGLIMWLRNGQRRTRGVASHVPATSGD